MNTPVHALAQRGPDEAPERLRASARRGRNRYNGVLFANLNDESDPDDLAPEESVTKQFWKDLYEGIQRWRNKSVLGLKNSKNN